MHKSFFGTVLRGAAVSAGVLVFAAGAAAQDTTTLQLLHATDLEGNADAVESAPNFATIVDALEDTHPTTLIISSGDNFIPSPFSNAAASQDPQVREALDAALNEVMSRVTGESTTSLSSAAGRFDIAIMNAIGFDASALGNHEFDFGQDQLLAVVAAGDDWTGAFFPYLTANLVFEDESVLRAVYDADGVAPGENARGVIAPFAIIEDNGERFGVIGATTQLVTSISSTFGDPDNPNDDVEAHGTIDMAVLAGRIQPVIDALEADGVDRIILTSHLQQFSLEVELAGLLDGVDIIIAGGSDTLLADADDRLRRRDEAAEDYPFLTEDAGGSPVAIVATDGQYTYVGRLVVDFDANGDIVPESIDPAVSGAFATDEAGVLAVTGAADLDGAIASSTKGSAVRDLVNVVQTAVLETSGNTFFARQAVDLNGERNPGVRSEETNLGNLTADANLVTARSLSGGDVHVSIKNGGGIRASIPTGDGFVSELEIQQTLAFNNTLTLLTLTPAQLYETLSYAVSGNAYDADGNATDVSGRFPQVGGLRFSFDPSLPAEEQVRDIVLVGAGADGGDVKIYDDGAPTDAAAALTDGIRVVTLSFMAGGGDGYPFPAFVAADSGFADVVDLHQPDVIADGAAQFTNVGSEQDALAEYLAENFPVDGDAAIDLADTPAADDTRIVNLGVPGASDL